MTTMTDFDAKVSFTRTRLRFLASQATTDSFADLLLNTADRLSMLPKRDVVATAFFCDQTDGVTGSDAADLLFDLATDLV